MISIIDLEEQIYRASSFSKVSQSVSVNLPYFDTLFIQPNGTILIYNLKVTGFLVMAMAQFS